MKPLMLAAAAWLGLSAPAWAQYPYVRPQTNPYNKPIVPPAVLLNRGGFNPAAAWFGIVQPQMELATGLAQLQQAQAQGGAVVTGADPNLPMTGHPTRFLNYTQYFMTQGGGSQYRTGAQFGAGQYGAAQYATTGATANNPFGPQRPRTPGR